MLCFAELCALDVLDALLLNCVVPVWSLDNVILDMLCCDALDNVMLCFAELCGPLMYLIM